ncbi:MAG: AMP-binding protein [Deltaproteobacteria bacterium]|nr:AMP-binding protein [Deltaproteobacteria bacterium]
MSHNLDEKPWFSQYKIHGIPKSLAPYPKFRSHSFLEQAAEKYPKMGYVQLGYEMSYPEAREKAARLANALYALGTRKEDRVLTLLPTSIQFVLADHAISMAGAVHVPCSFLEPPEHLLHKFKESAPKTVLVQYEYQHVVDSIKESFRIETVIITRVEDYSENPRARETPPDGTYWLTDLIDTHPPQAPAVEVDPERDLEILLFTGGTTGIPKGCMLSHYNVTSNATQQSYALGISSQIMIGNIAVLIGLPFFHSYGHCIMHTMTLLGFKQLLVPDARDTKSMAEMIKEHYPILQLGVPTQFMKMLDEELKGVSILGISGSAPLRPEIQEKFEKKGAGFIMEGYGLSEMSPTTHLNTSVMLRLFGGSGLISLLTRFLQLPGQVAFARFIASIIGYRWIGRIFYRLVPLLTKLSKLRPKLITEEKRATIGVPLPDTEVKIIDVESGGELSYDELVKDRKVGEMLLSGPQRMLGYWPQLGTGFDEDGYIHTGDVVRVDDQGYFYIEDRIKDMIVVSGYKVYSKEIEDILYKHPAVAMAATIGIVDPERPGSERVKVFIQPKPESLGKVSGEEIIAYLRERIAKYAVPSEVEFINEMPLTEVFKVNKKLLREQETKKRASAPVTTAPSA